MSQIQIGGRIIGNSIATTAAFDVMSKLREQTASQSNRTALAGKVMSMESLGGEDQPMVQAEAQRLETILKSITGGKVTFAQESAAVLAGLAASDVKSVQSWAMGASIAAVATAKDAIVVGATGNGVLEKRLGMEAYDERENKNVQAYSMAYNLQATENVPFVRTFYPTVVISHDQVGISLTARNLFVMDAIERQANGDLNKFNAKNVVRAIIDHTILDSDTTAIVPVYRKAVVADPATDTFQYFVDDVVPQDIEVGGATVKTAPLKMGAEVSLLGVSQTDAMLRKGVSDDTDAVDTFSLTSLTLKFGTGAGAELIDFDVTGLPTTDANAAVQGHARQLQLNFETNDLSIKSGLLTRAGAASTILNTALGQNVARIGVVVNGKILQDKGDTVMNAGALNLRSVSDATGQSLGLTGALANTLRGILATAVVVGYNFKSNRTNSNRLELGKLLYSQAQNYLYVCPLLSPITARRPVMAGDAGDQQSVSDLVGLVRARACNMGTTAILEARDLLEAHASTPDVVHQRPDVFGPASKQVVPQFLSQSVNVADDLDSLRTSERRTDVQALLVNKLRDMGARLFTNSGMGPALDYFYGGTYSKPVLLVACDPVVHSYLVRDGDSRVAGEQFDIIITENYDARMEGRILMSFGRSEALTSGGYEQMHFGNLIYRPELTVMLPNTRESRQSFEMTVTPSMRFINNLPVMGELVVTGIEAAVGGKVFINANTRVIP